MLKKFHGKHGGLKYKYSAYIPAVTQDDLHILVHIENLGVFSLKANGNGIDLAPLHKYIDKCLENQMKESLNV